MSYEAWLQETMADKVIDLRCRGLTVNRICDRTGIPAKIVKKILWDDGLMSRGNMTNPEKQAWLELHWNWQVKEPEKPKKEHMFRVVHPGDRGIRTPYRPDGIFR